MATVVRKRDSSDEDGPDHDEDGRFSSAFWKRRKLQLANEPPIGTFDRFASFRPLSSFFSFFPTVALLQ